MSLGFGIACAGLFIGAGQAVASDTTTTRGMYQIGAFAAAIFLALSIGEYT